MSSSILRALIRGTVSKEQGRQDQQEQNRTMADMDGDDDKRILPWPILIWGYLTGSCIMLMCTVYPSNNQSMEHLQCLPDNQNNILRIINEVDEAWVCYPSIWIYPTALQCPSTGTNQSRKHPHDQWVFNIRPDNPRLKAISILLCQPVSELVRFA